MLDETIIEDFNKLIKKGDFGEIKLLERESTSILREKGKNRYITETDSHGFGIRVYHNGLSALASDTILSKKAVKKAVERAYGSIKTKGKGAVKPVQRVKDAEISPIWKKDARYIEPSEKMELAKDTEEAARLKGVELVSVAYGDQTDRWIISNSYGGRLSFYNSYPRLIVSVFVKDGNSMQNVTKSRGGNGGFELMDRNELLKMAGETAGTALKLRGAKPVIGGRYDTVLDHSMTGVYTHEAFGHATEADAVMNRSSILENRLEKRVGPEIVSIVDDPTIKNARGSYLFDQEGTKAARRVLVDRGVLKSYLHSNETAGVMGSKPNGAARAMNHSSNPIPRMSNTFISAGEFSDDIFEGIKKGVAFYGFQYGYTDPGSGKFMFKSQYGRMIKNGKLGEYVRDAALAGSTLDVLNKIDAIGRRVEFDDGMCGKLGQWVPVTSGGPEIRIRGVVVGGQ